MKKSSLFFAMIIFPVLSYSQFSAGFTAGYNVSKTNVELRDLSTFKIKPGYGFNAGMFLEYRFNQAAGLLSGLSVTQKGFSHHLDIKQSPETDSTVVMTNKLTYLELPVYLKLNTFIKETEFFFAIGPYVSYGLQGKIVTETSGRDVTIQTDEVSWNKNNEGIKSEMVRLYGYSGIKRWDYGIASLIGFRHDNLLFSVSYKYGLKNIMWEYYADEKISNSAISFAIGYYLSGGKKPSK